MDTATDAAVDIRPTYNPLGFAAEAAPIFAMVWGQPPVSLRWRQATRIPVPAGQSAVGIWMKWFTKAHMGLCHAVVQLAPGELVGLEWKAPNTVFTAGKLAVVDLGPPSSLAVTAATGVPVDLGNRVISPPHPIQVLASVPVVETAPAAVAWYPDPTGRFVHRWWDGARWTDSVSDGTTTTTDPI